MRQFRARLLRGSAEVAPVDAARVGTVPDGELEAGAQTKGSPIAGISNRSGCIQCPGEDGGRASVADAVTGNEIQACAGGAGPLTASCHSPGFGGSRDPAGHEASPGFCHQL